MAHIPHFTDTILTENQGEKLEGIKNLLIQFKPQWKKENIKLEVSAPNQATSRGFHYIIT